MPKAERSRVELLLASALLAGACAGARSAGSTGEPISAPANAAVAQRQAPCPANPITTAEARMLIDEYCVSCHSPGGTAGPDFDFRSDPAILRRRRNIEAKLRLHVMPPPNAQQPSDTERSALRCWAKG